MTDPAPPRGVDLCIRIGVATYCLGTGVAALSYQPPAFSFLFQGLDWSSGATQTFVEYAAYLLIAITALVFVRRATPLGLIALLWIALEIGTSMYTRSAFHQLSPASTALRSLAPIALLLTWRHRFGAAMWVMRIAAAATFAAHGLKCLANQPPPEFVDYILVAFHKIGVSLADETGYTLLLPIGVTDILVALAILVYPKPWILYYMAFWGLVTALSRIVHSGSYGATDCIVRVIHCTGPLAVALHTRYAHDAQAADTPRATS